MSVRLDLLDNSLAVALENYKDNVRILAALDDKAQKMGAIAGLFLGALFAVIKPDTISSLETTIGHNGMRVLTAVILLLIACTTICLASMWVGKMPPPLSLAHMTQLTNDLLHLPLADLNDDIQEAYRQEKLNVWRACLHAQGGVANRKAVLVFAAQAVLVVGILAFAFMLLRLLHVDQTFVPLPSSYPK
jgi:hypothetical protein